MGNDLKKLANAEHGDPFGYLGRHGSGRKAVYRCFMPRVRRVCFGPDQWPMKRKADTDLFELHIGDRELPAHPRVSWEDDTGGRREAHDPYSFAPGLDDNAMRDFQSGRNFRAQDLLGAHCVTQDDVPGVRFAVWAPNAGRASVVGDFNKWDGRCHPMRFHPEFGIWELFIPGLESGAYKFELRNRVTGNVVLKADPFARRSEMRPATASLVCPPSSHTWKSHGWSEHRRRNNTLRSQVSVYEVHLGSWKRGPQREFLDYRALAHQLCAHIKPLGFTHIELLPMKEHPLDESWGYQSTGYFAPTSRHGKPDDFRAFVDICHQNGIGVILDWVPAHFPRDEHALARFDGSALFEYPDPWKAEHRDWGTLIFNYERNEVRSFLISSALYWLREFRLDGLRVDAVASMLYLNFSRQSEQWAPNRYGGHHNLEAVEFLRELNSAIAAEHPDCLMIAEESSDWHGVTAPVEAGGLGFSLKWNMGWMHDTLNYMKTDPLYRKHHHDWLTFGPVYAFNENFMLPLSHDEVVHLKRSLYGRMPGDEWQRFANLRLLYGYQWLYPGKQLLFMGSEFAQEGEWNSNESLPWDRAGQPLAKGVQRTIAALNRLQAKYPALRQWDCDSRGFEWLDGDDAERSVIAFLRRAEEDSLVVILNFTPEPRQGYRIPIHRSGRYHVVFNSDDSAFGGSGFELRQSLESDAEPLKGRDQSLSVDLPPLSALVLECQI